MICATALSHLAFLSLLTIAALIVGSVVRAQDSSNTQQKSDPFLGDYSGLAPDAKNGDLLVYEKNPTVLKKYNKFIFDPITIYLLPEAQDRGMTRTIWSGWLSISIRPSPMNLRNPEAIKS